MRCPPPALFHVGCPFTGRGVCQCSHGTPVSLRSPKAAAVYGEQARAAWDLWLDPAKTLGAEDAVEVLLPRLVKVERVVRKTGGSAAGLPSRKEAERAVHITTRAAEQSALKAAKLAAAAGLDFAVPEGLDVELPPVEKVDHSELEAAVEALMEGSKETAAAAAAADPQQQRKGSAVVVGGGEASEGTILASATSRDTGARSAGGAAQPSAGEGRSSSRQAARAAAAVAAAVAAAAAPIASTEDFVQPSLPLHVKVQVKAAASSGKSVKAEQSERSPALPAAPQVDMSAFPPGYSLRGPSTKHPPKSWGLKMKDYKPTLAGEMVQLYWPDDGQWWPAAVISVSNVPGVGRRASLYYETGDEEATDLTPLIKAGEVAWLLGPGGGGGTAAAHKQPPTAAQPPSTWEGVARSGGAVSTGAVGGDKRGPGRDQNAAEGDDSATEDEEDPVLLRLRHVTKRQRQTAASGTAGGGADSGGAQHPHPPSSQATLCGEHKGQRPQLSPPETTLFVPQQEGLVVGGHPGPAVVRDPPPGNPPPLPAGGPRHSLSIPEQPVLAPSHAAPASSTPSAAPPPPAPAASQGPPPSAMRELLALGPAAVGRMVQLRLGSIQQPFYGVVADVLREQQQVRVQLGGRYAALNARDEGFKFLIYLA